MSTYDTRNVLPKSSIYLNGVTQRGGGSVLYFDAQTGSITLGSTTRGMYVNSSDQLVFWNGTTSTTLGSAGSLMNFSLDDGYDDGSVITVDTGSITLNANITDPALQITQSGTGADITGTSTTWSISKAGALTCISIADSATNATLQVNGNGSGGVDIGSTSTGGITLGAAVTVASAKAFTITGTAGTDYFTITAGDAVISDGSLTITDNDNAATVAVVNATTTTSDVFTVTANGLTTGSVALFTTSGTVTSGGEGVVNIVGSGVTSGDGLKIDLTEGTLNGGNYINCYDDSDTETVFKVAENGAVTITGSAVGTAAITVTAGDLTLTDAVVSVTNTGTVDVMSITANNLLANNALIVKGSGIFTGTGASSFVAITPTGATTGTGLYIALAAATTLSYALDITTSTTTGIAARLTNTGILTGVGAALSIIADSATTAGASAGEGVVNVSADGLTTGAAFNVESISNELMTSGVLAHFDHSAVGTTIAAKTGSLVSITSSMTESGTSTQDFDMVSIVRTSVHDTAGTLTATGSLMYLENVATETGATLTDTVNGLEVVMDAQGTGTGVKVTHPATTGKSLDVIASTTTGTVALLTMDSLTTTGVGLSLTNTGTGVTSGSVLRVASGTTSAVATNGVVSLFATGAFTSTAVTDGFVRINGNSTLTGTVMAINGNSFTSGIGLNIGDTGTGMTSGSLLRATSATTGAVATNGIMSVQATGAYTSTANMGILSAIANTTTAGTVAYVSATSMVGGTLLFLNATAATLTGKYIQCYDGAADDFSVGQYGATIIAGNGGSNVLTVSAGDIVVSDGSLTLTDADNAATLDIINNTATTIGNASGDGVVSIASTSLTTGALLNLELTEGTLANGWYLQCWDVTAGTAVFSIEEDGEVNLARGRATTAGGADAINIGASAAIKVLWGSGAPSATAPQGSLYLRTDGSSTSTRMYVNTDGAGTWASCTTSA